MGGSKGGSQTIGYKYFMSLHMGLARGPIDEIVQIDVGNVRAWPIPDGDPDTESGVALVARGPGGVGVRLYENGKVETVSASLINTHSGSGSLRIRAPELFGGDRKEGGIDGTATVMMGGPTQIVAQWIKNLMGGRVPDFRGVATLFYDGLLCSLNPYPKQWKIRARRTENGWDGPVWQPSLVTIWMRDGAIKAMNPAHIVYECLTNRDWGRGFPRAFMNDNKMLATAQTLFDEGLGLCLRWNRQGELGNFIQEIVDHAGGSLYPDPTTGLMTFELLRGDYDPEEIPLFTYDTGLLSIEEETATQDDIVNEVIVNWNDPIQNKDRQARVHNLASLQTLGATASNTISYAGAPTVELALRLGQRDLKAVATSLKRYKVSLDRRAWRLIPGGVFRVSAPDKNIYNVIVRAGKVRKAEITSGEIQVDAVLDVFGMPAVSFVGAPTEEFTAPDRTARVITNRLVREATYRDLVIMFSEDERDEIADESGAIVVIATKPSTQTLGFRIHSKVGVEAYEARGAADFVPMAVSAQAIERYDTLISFTGAQDLGLVEVGMAVQIGNEICRLDEITASDPTSGTMTITRGCVDTLPQAHASGTDIFFIGTGGGSDGREYGVGETVDIKLISFTSTAELSEALAPVDSQSIMGRHARPWPPADLHVNDAPFGGASTVPSGPITLTWAHRNRLSIQDQLIGYDAASMVPEPGTTYTVRVYLEPNDTTPIRTVTGIAGTEFIYTAAMALADGVSDTVAFEIEAVRDGLVSTYRYRFGLVIADGAFEQEIAVASIAPSSIVPSPTISDGAFDQEIAVASIAPTSTVPGPTIEQASSAAGYGQNYGVSYGP